MLVENQRTQVVELAPNSLPQEERTLALEYGKRLTNAGRARWPRLRLRAFVKWTDEENFPPACCSSFPKPQIPSLGDPKVITAYAENDNAAALPRLRQRYEAMGRLLSLSATEVRRRTITSYTWCLRADPAQAPRAGWISWPTWQRTARPTPA